MPDRESRHRLPAPLIATLVGVGVYAVAVFWSSRHLPPMALALAALPFVWFAAVYAKNGLASQAPAAVRFLKCLPLLILTLTLFLAWQPLLNNVRLLYLAQHVGVHAALFWLFARTLLPGRTPLCTELAAWVHEDMTSPRLLGYTRQVTQTWTIFFGLMVVLSVLLFRYATPEIWTAFSAVVGPLMTGVVFLVENLLRNHVLPPQDRVGLAGTWRAVRARIEDQAQPQQRAP